LRLQQAQLLAGQFTRKDFTIAEGNGCLELGVFGVNVRQIVVLVG
jgi:hypothetical protein